MPRSRSLPLLSALAACVLLLGGCASSPTEDPQTGEMSGGDADALTGEVTIFAAASLAVAFDEIAAQFEQAYPGVDVRPISYDGSSTLATQIVEGAPADVFASADEETMASVVEAGLAAEPALFATNTLVIAVPAGNPAEITGPADLSDPAARVVLCAPEVPCGAASQTLLADRGVRVIPASSEQNVTAVLTKVAAGEADAGLVYATDVAGRDDVEVIIPEGAADVVNRYPIVALEDAADPEVAAAFVAFVLGEGGRSVLAEDGFGSP